MNRINVDELRRKYNCAKSDHNMWETAYLNELENAKQYFLSGRYERANELLKSAMTWLELSANAMDEMKAYEKELIKRKASY